MENSLASLSKIFAALSSQNRLKILLYIYDRQHRCKGKVLRCRNEACINDLAKSLNVAIPTASHHIKELVNAGLVTTEKKGKWVYCAINRPVFEKVTRFLDKWSAIETK